jgi:hypothetical protein
MGAMLSTFAHTVDSVCWDLANEDLYDPLDCSGSILERQLNLGANFFEGKLPADIAYFALKSVYLILRHKFQPDCEVKRLINVPHIYNPLHMKRCYQMSIELIALGIDLDSIERLRLIDDGRSASAIRKLSDQVREVWSTHV